MRTLCLLLVMLLLVYWQLKQLFGHPPIYRFSFIAIILQKVFRCQFHSWVPQRLIYTTYDLLTIDIVAP
jgi:hypothetical protein